LPTRFYLPARVRWRDSEGVAELVASSSLYIWRPGEVPPGAIRGRGWLVHRGPIGSGDGLQTRLVATRSKHAIMAEVGSTPTPGSTIHYFVEYSPLAATC
jgi:hypothetical protein